MQLNEIKTPFETRKFFMIGTDGKSVVKHNKKVQLVTGNLYRGEDETRNGRSWTTCDLFVLYPEAEIGLFVTQADVEETVEGYVDGFEKNGMTDKETFLKMIQHKIDTDMFIGKHYIAFLKQFAPELVPDAWEARKRYGERSKHENDEKRAAEEKARQEKEAAEAAEKAAQDARDRALFDGWADGMTALKFGKVFASMNKLIRVDGKILYDYEFIKYRINQGFKPKKRENVQYYKHGGYGELTKPKTEYLLTNPENENIGNLVNKTEFEFASYLYERKNQSAAV